MNQTNRFRIVLPVEIEDEHAPFNHYINLTLALILLMILDFFMTATNEIRMPFFDILIFSISPFCLIFIIIILVNILPVIFYEFAAIFGPFCLLLLYFFIRNKEISGYLIFLLQIYSSIKILSIRELNIEKRHLKIFYRLSIEILEQFIAIGFSILAFSLYFSFYLVLLVNFAFRLDNVIFIAIKLTIAIFHIEQTFGLCIIMLRIFLSNHLFDKMICKYRGTKYRGSLIAILKIFGTIFDYRKTLENIYRYHYFLYNGAYSITNSSLKIWRYDKKYCPIVTLVKDFFVSLFDIFFNNPTMFFFLGQASYPDLFYSLIGTEPKLVRRVFYKLRKQRLYLRQFKHSVIALIILFSLLYQLVFICLVEVYIFISDLKSYIVKFYIFINLYFVFWLVFNVFDTIYKSYILLYIWDAEVLTKNGIDVEELENTF